MSAIFLFQRGERGTDPGDDGAGDLVFAETADHAVVAEGGRTRSCLSLTWDERPLDVLASLMKELDGSLARGKGDWGRWEELHPGPGPAVVHFLGHRCRPGGRGVAHARSRMPWTIGPRSPGSKPSRLFSGRRRWRFLALWRSGSRLRLDGAAVFAMGALDPSNQRSLCQRRSLEEGLLICLLPRSRRSTSFGRDSRSGIVLGGTSSDSCQETSGPRLPGPLLGWGVQREASGEDFVEVWKARRC